MRLPKAIQNLITSFEKLPGIGPKTAERLTFYLFRVPQAQLNDFAESLQKLKTSTMLCSRCYTIAETELCDICSDPLRDQMTICVVEEPLDVIALEKSERYKGVYHVLHGRIDPLNNVGPEEIYVQQLMDRIRAVVRHPELVSGSQKDSGSESGMTNIVREVILATNPTMEGEATAMFLAKQLKALNIELRVTRIGRGLPVGADIEYADGITLQRAMEGRQEM